MTSSSLTALRDFAGRASASLPRIALLNVAAGVASGVIIAAPPVLIHFQAVLANCALALTQGDCAAVSAASRCAWDPAHAVCLGGVTVAAAAAAAASTADAPSLATSTSPSLQRDFTTCDPAWAKERCVSPANPLCDYLADKHVCAQARGFGWGDLETGLFASAAVFGAMLGTLIASATARHEQTKRLGQFGVCVFLGALASWLTWMLSGRSAAGCSVGLVVCGVGFGGLFAVAPAVVSSVVAPAQRSLAGTVVQLSVTVAICLTALVALMFGGAPSVAPHFLYLPMAAMGGVCYYVAEAIAAPIVVEHNKMLASSSLSSGVGRNNNDDDEEEAVDAHMTYPSGLPPQNIDGAPPGLLALPAAVSMNKHNRGGGGDDDGDRDEDHDGNHADDTTSLVMQKRQHQSDAPSSSSGSGSGELPAAAAAAAAAAPTTTTLFFSSALERMRQRKLTLVQTSYTCGIVLAAALQFTGINATMSYASRISAAAGIQNPLLGNFVIMLWNMLATLPAIPLSGRYPPAQLYLTGLLGASTFCFLTAAAMLLESPALALVCVCGFLGFFATCLGPMFFSLMTEIFPPDVRSVAVGRVNLVNFVCNLIVNFSYPALVSFLGGDDRGGGASGVRRVFVLFGILGVISFGLLQVLFPQTYLGGRNNKLETPPQEPEAAAAAAAAAVQMTSTVPPTVVVLSSSTGASTASLSSLPQQQQVANAHDDE